MPQIIVFGQLTDLVQSSSIAIPDVPDTDALRKALTSQFPALATAKFAIAVDQQIITTNTLLTEKSTVALLPPFSGG
jgi:molybdopterin synthase sulfur carrier subunit